uniref:Chemokine interleukin-8-like domain-containing protein n=1 Tax=Denticeps clupeoides TaxID=299321 RepID=A0AAY3ZWM4_9TELE
VIDFEIILKNLSRPQCFTSQKTGILTRVCGKTGLSCCTTVSNAEISDPIISFSYQKDNGFECVNSVIITTERGPFCINPRSRWLLHKIREFL